MNAMTNPPDAAVEPLTPDPPLPPGYEAPPVPEIHVPQAESDSEAATEQGPADQD